MVTPNLLKAGLTFLKKVLS